MSKYSLTARIAIILGLALFTLHAVMFIGQYVSTLGWKTTSVASSTGSTTQCEPLQGRVDLFSYRDQTRYASYDWQFHYEVNGESYTHIDCVDKPNSIKIIYYNPNDPSDSIVEPNTQLAQLAMYAFIGLIFISIPIIGRYFFPPIEERPLI